MTAARTDPWTDGTPTAGPLPADRPRLCFVVESGCDVRLVDGLAERFDLTVLARRITGGVEISHPPRNALVVTVGPPGRGAFARMAWSYLRTHAFDAVVVQGYGPAAVAANLARRATGALTLMLVCSPGEAYYRCRRDHPAPGKPFRHHELLALEAVARINARIGGGYIVLSQHLAGIVRAHGGDAPVDVIPIYGVDTTIFAPPAEPRDVIRARLGLPREGRIVFFSSRIAPEKDGEAVLAAIRDLRARGRDLWLLHYSGGHRGFVSDAERYGLADRVIAGDALHPHDALPAAYQASDLCVQASRAEGLGFSPLEALACGVPAVATHVGGLRETIIDGETGWSYPAGDVRALAGRIASALDDPAEARRRAAAGRHLVQRHFERRTVFDRFEERVRDGLATASATNVITRERRPVASDTR
jgi:glycosyltransferase involved in cell wall biosynthesis